MEGNIPFWIVFVSGLFFAVFWCLSKGSGRCESK
jgi:hypothetical protein